MGRKTIQPVPGFKNRRRDGTPSGNAKVIQPVPGFGKRKRPNPIGKKLIGGVPKNPKPRSGGGYEGVISVPAGGTATPPPRIAHPSKKGSKPNAGFRSKKFPGVM